MTRFRVIFSVTILCCVFPLCRTQFFSNLFQGGVRPINPLNSLVNGLQSGINRLFGANNEQQNQQQYFGQPLNAHHNFIDPGFIYPQTPNVQPSFTYVQQPQQPNFVYSQRPIYNDVQQRPTFINVVETQPIFTDFRRPSVNTQPSGSQQFILNNFNRPSESNVQQKPVQNYQKYNDEIEQIFNTQPVSSNSNQYDKCGESKTIVPLISNGFRATKGDWPWIVAVYIKNRVSTGNTHNMFKCGSTLISEKVVVTAAHCVTRRNLLPESTESILLKLGAYNLDDEADETVISRGASLIKVHEGYNAENQNDIALIFMSQIVKFNYYIRPICLWSFDSNQKYIDGLQGTVVGWGRDETGTIAAEPRTIKVPILSVEKCRNAGKQYFTVTNENTFCAGARDGSGPCSGDSGGGLFVMRDSKWYLRGLVSLSLSKTKMCNLSNYVIYTDIAKYDSWIREKIR